MSLARDIQLKSVKKDTPQPQEWFITTLARVLPPKKYIPSKNALKSLEKSIVNKKHL
jgi:hypothetical protein